MQPTLSSFMVSSIGGVAAIGDDCLITTTDYPHGDSKYPHAMEHFLRLELTPESQRKILWDNTVRLYDL
jgi:predicted TIM-barrel fold metal-dependent hydrolase